MVVMGLEREADVVKGLEGEKGRYIRVNNLERDKEIWGVYIYTYWG